jgi:F0F1-type ATP synthase membrane subunit b/b'
MFNDYFYIFLSFIGFIGLSYSFIKNTINSLLTAKINAVESSIGSAEKSRKDTHDMLIALKADYEETKKQFDTIMENAKHEANAIMQETERKILTLSEKSQEAFEEYKNRARETMVEELKGSVLVTVLNIIENEALNNHLEQIQNIENSKKILKKIWN